MTGNKPEMINKTITQVFDDILKRQSDITDKHSETAGISLYVCDRKFLQINEASQDRIEFLILRDPDQDYCRPQHSNLDIQNIRKYDPSQKSYIRPWGYMFYRVLITPDQYLDNKNVLIQLIDKSYEIAKDEKILKVSKTEHEQLGPIFDGTYVFEENDGAETPTTETSDTIAEHSEPPKEELKKIVTEENDEPSSDEILSENEVEEVESEKIPSVDVKKVVADETDPDRQVFNYIAKDPKKTISILNNINISTFLDLIKKEEIDSLELLNRLLSDYEIPTEYVNAFLENRLSKDVFHNLIVNAHSNWSGSPEDWPQIDFIIGCYEEMNQDIVKLVKKLETDKSNIGMEFGFNISDDWGIKSNRLIELFQYPITPILGMTMEEAEIIFGYPSNDKEDVMKTKTVVTWTYLKGSNKMDREVIALELKFRNDELERYIDKRDNTNWSNDLDEFSDSIYTDSTNVKEILMLYLAMGSLFKGEVTNNYQECENQCMDKIAKNTSNSIARMESKIIKEQTQYNDASNYMKKYYKDDFEKVIDSGKRLLEDPCKINWNNSLFPLPKFSEGKKLLDNKVSEIISGKDVADNLASLRGTLDSVNLGKSGCFVATATMGSYNHPTVIHLREFRDMFLLEREWGTLFVKYYYKYSPYTAKIIEKSSILRFASNLIIIKPLTVITKQLLKNENNKIFN